VTVALAGEAALIRHLRKVFRSPDDSLKVGIGDDAAVFSIGDASIVATTDLLLPGVHFRPDTLTPFQLGYKSVAVNISDLRAMGARPRHLLLGLALPPQTPLSDFYALAEGLRTAATRFGVTVAGGDTCRSDHGMLVSITALGETKRPVLRSGARPGDGLFVTGSLGNAALGLEILKRIGHPVDPDGREPVRLEIPTETGPHFHGEIPAGPFMERDLRDLIRRHVLPEPPDNPPVTATAMLDISDGLLIDLNRLCDASDVGVRLETGLVPTSLALRKVAPCLGLSPLDLALSGGEDYELLFAAPADTATGNETQKTAVRIGTFVEGPREIVETDGKIRPLRPEGFDHFSLGPETVGFDEGTHQ